MIDKCVFLQTANLLKGAYVSAAPSRMMFFGKIFFFFRTATLIESC